MLALRENTVAGGTSVALYYYEETLTSRRRKEADDDCHLQDAHSKRHAGMAGDTRHIYRHDFE